MAIIVKHEFINPDNIPSYCRANPDRGKFLYDYMEEVYGDVRHPIVYNKRDGYGEVLTRWDSIEDWNRFRADKNLDEIKEAIDSYEKANGIIKTVIVKEL